MKTTPIFRVHSRGVNFPEVVFHHSSKRENEGKQKKVNNLRLEGDLTEVEEEDEVEKSWKFASHIEH